MKKSYTCRTWHKVCSFLVGFLLDGNVQSEPFNKETLETALKNEIVQHLKTDEFQLQISTWQASWKKDGIDAIVVDNISYLDHNRRFKAKVNYGTITKIIMGSIQRKVLLPVFVMPQDANKMISDSDISFQEFEENQVAFDVVLRKEDLLGMKVRQGRMVKSNAPIRKTDIEKPIVVKRGDSIRVHFVDPTFEVSIVGKAESNASVGDKISFEVGDKKSVQAIVTQSGNAEIRDSL